MRTQAQGRRATSRVRVVVGGLRCSCMRAPSPPQSLFPYFCSRRGSKLRQLRRGDETKHPGSEHDHDL